LAWDKPGGNITGTSDLSPVGIQLDQLKELLPSASRVGVIFNPLEENSTIIVDLFKTECRKRGLTPVTATVSSQNEIKQTLVSLIGKIDALYAPTDATIQESFSVLSKLGRELRIPVFNCDRSTVENGAVFSVGFNYEELGRVSAEMSWQILAEGKSPADMPIRLADKAHLFYSSEQINYFGLSVPETWKQVGESVPK
jgi:putative ABC transport system substrate-binding protein